MINLIPPELRESRVYGRRNVSLTSYSIALLATAVLTASIIIASLQFIDSEEPDLLKNLESSKGTITLLEKEVASVEAVANRLETAKLIEEQSVSFSELIPKIGAVLPEGVVLNALSLTGGKTDPIQLDISLKDATLAPVMIRNLVDSDLFEAADISSLSPKGTSADDTTGYLYTASISASFTGTAEALKKIQNAEAAKKAAADAAAAEAAKGQQ